MFKKLASRAAVFSLAALTLSSEAQAPSQKTPGPLKGYVFSCATKIPGEGIYSEENYQRVAGVKPFFDKATKRRGYVVAKDAFPFELGITPKMAEGAMNLNVIYPTLKKAKEESKNWCAHGLVMFPTR